MITKEMARELAKEEFGDMIMIKRDEEGSNAYFFYPNCDNSCLHALAVYKETGEVVNLATYMMRKL